MPSTVNLQYIQGHPDTKVMQINADEALQYELVFS